jgi:signal transduction histidine kinase
MTLLADAEKIRLSVADDGRGFALSSELEEPVKMAGIGLTGMYERLETMGGSLEVQSAPGQGTTLIASVPIVEELAAV